MRLDLGRTWADARDMASANRDVLSAVAGMFILLPSILSQWVVPDKPAPPKGATLETVVDMQMDFIVAHWPAFVANALVIAFGSLALLALLVHRSQPTVAAAMRLALPALPFYVLASILQSFAVAIGLMALVVPGLYLIARMVCIAPVAAAEEGRGPVMLIQRSFAVTRGNGWRILLMVSVLFMVLTVIFTALSTLVGILALLLMPVEVGRLALIIVEAFYETVLAVAILIVSASIYRQATSA